MRQATTKKAENVTPTRADRPHKGLTEEQETIAELASDMIMNGGAKEDVDLFLRAVGRHRYRLLLASFSQTGKPIAEADINSDAEHSAKQWCGALANQWQHKKPAKRLSATASTSNSVAEIARTDIRGHLKGLFNEFVIGIDSFESAYLLKEILEYTVDGGYDMAQAFARVMDGDQTYVRIPGDIEDEVRNFIKMLRNCDRKSCERGPIGNEIAKRTVSKGRA